MRPSLFRSIRQGRWKGRWLMVVAAIHTLFALVVFGDVLANIVRRGLFDTVGDDPLTGAVVWFLLFGALLFICGLLLSELERRAPGPLPRSIGWSLLLLAATGILLMPASGFWLALPPAAAIVIGGMRQARLA